MSQEPDSQETADTLDESSNAEVKDVTVNDDGSVTGESGDETVDLQPADEETEQAISELVAGDSAPVDSEHVSRLWLPGQSHSLETECNELWANSPELRERFNSKKTNFRASFIQDPDSFRD